MCQTEHIGLGDVVARWVVRIDEQQRVDVFCLKMAHQVIGRVMQIIGLRHEGFYFVFGQTVGIFLESGIHHTHPAGGSFHQALDQLGRTIPHHNVLAAHAKIFGSKK